MTKPRNLSGMTATVARVEILSPSLIVALTNSRQFLHRREKIETRDEVIETTACDRPALIRAGGIHYVAVWMDDTASVCIPTALCHKAGIAADPLPEGLRRCDTETQRFLFNYNVFSVEWGGRNNPAGGVSWQEI